MKLPQDRRRNRSDNTYQALRHQLEACRQRAGLEGMVLTDDSGLPLASAGQTDACDEVAARLAMVGRKVPSFVGVLFSNQESWAVTMRRFTIGAIELFMCAIGGDADPRAVEVERSIGGASRILA